MNPRTLRRAGCASLLALCLLAPAAAAKPSVTLTLPPQGADAGAATPFSFTAAKVPKRAKLVVQRQMGTAKSYGTVAKLPKASTGTGSIPALDLGRYRLRIAVIGKKPGKRKRRVLAQQKHKLTVYGTVDFKTLFRRTARTYTTSSNSFSYTFDDGVGNDPETLLTVDSKANACRSVHADWVADPDYDDEPSVGNLSILQEAKDPVKDSASANEISEVGAFITPGQSWAISAVTTGTRDGMTYYVNGTASCYKGHIDYHY